jgi:hypothetical protein
MAAEIENGVVLYSGLDSITSGGNMMSAPLRMNISIISGF